MSLRRTTAAENVGPATKKVAATSAKSPYGDERVAKGIALGYPPEKSIFKGVIMSLRHTTAAENEAAGVKPLGGLVGLPPAKASIPVRRQGTSRLRPLPRGCSTPAPFQGASWQRSTGI